MLIAKRPDKIRLIIYIIIIAAMFSGSGFFIYKSFFSQSKDMSSPADFNFDAIGINGDGDVGARPSGAEKGGLDVSRTDKALNLEVFNDQRFKNLKETKVDLLIKEKIGQDNPFRKK